MLITHSDRTTAKGWCLGPWRTNLPVSIGYATTGIDEPHRHTRIQEIYLVASGQAQVLVAGERLRLVPGDVLLVEPGEGHTFLSSTPDYFHFVLHVPGLEGEAARAEKVSLTSEELEKES
jgi:mannose-6-phosphate isomerase-like protein (cupin superfamily)